MKKKDTDLIKIDPMELTFEVIDEIVKISELINKIGEEGYKRFELTQAQFKVLYYLYLCGDEGSTSSTLSKKLGVKKPSVTTLIDRMTLKGIVIRQENENDRRYTKISITEEGKKILAEIIPDKENIIASLVGVLPEEEMQILHESLIKIRQRLNNRFL
ncbi:MarR family transcriptional regulator [Clostridium carboxidivorans P7]|uniref:Transcriptional regulator, MarR family n=1 Tax=Clostridium carboxidivorans P7 TaxID=536227 RepID=C6PYX2_9CLOT|nr:MarR family transcriptional regulator [Clostridium carboxidivorans]AKN33156.1 MarR family transcriptional regulator [Clostridium carboxidivorans P7]EET85555.1 transcriptional regulator, MarR family [Clostridium carboxidivorans P7]EFG86952.1 transcriptional regulator, MarR family [Clostridium carboxidivorans P7]